MYYLLTCILCWFDKELHTYISLEGNNRDLDMMSHHRRHEEFDKVTGVRLLLAELLIVSKVAKQSKHRDYCTFLLVVVVNRLFIVLLIECIKKLGSSDLLIEDRPTSAR